MANRKPSGITSKQSAAIKAISIRPASPGDAAALLQIYAPYVTGTAITFEYEVPDIDEFRRRIAHTLEKYPYLVAEVNGEIVGYAYASPFKERAAYDWAVETSIYVDHQKKKMGIGKCLHDALESALKMQGILNMEACIASPEAPDAYLNRNSIEFHTHIGYRMVGEFKQCGYKFGRWYNMVWMEKLIGEHLDDQPAVLPFGTV